MDVQLPAPDRHGLLSAAAVARALDVRLVTAEKAIAAGLFGDVYTAGTITAVKAAGIDQYREREPRRLREMPSALVLQVGPPSVVNDDPKDWNTRRQWKGWSAYATSEERLAGWTRWWRLRDVESLVGRDVVVLVGPWAVERASIKDTSTYDGDVMLAVEACPLNEWADVQIDGNDLRGGGVKRNQV